MALQLSRKSPLQRGNMALQSSRKSPLQRGYVGWLFAAPWLIGFAWIGVYPTFMSLYYSLTNFNVLQSPQWVGIQNYRRMVGDHLFWQSVYNTVYITVVGVPLSILLGIGVAILLNQKLRGIGVFRTLVYLPSIVPPVAVAIVWLFILNPDYGLLNAGLSALHIPTPGWLASPVFSKPALLFMVLWQSGQVIVIMLAGLQDVPLSLYEAARIDGAGAWSVFRRITLPMLSPVVFYNVIMGVVNSLQFFAQAYVASAGNVGAPVNSTLFYTEYLYENAFQYLRLGYAAAMAWGLLLITLLLTWVIFRVGNRAVFYGGE